ncbi:hypothetical protein H6771_02340 [Candidatus Peribacteria bacterium]|nr:hypothetical protein [Candidatus Peribacteria bacterium]
MPRFAPSHTIQEILLLMPEAEELLTDYGLSCSNCAVGGTETLQEAMTLHRYSEETLELLLADLEDYADELHVPQPLCLTVTPAALTALSALQTEQDLPGAALLIEYIPDGTNAGSYALDFITDAHRYPHTRQQLLTIATTTESLPQVQGATLDSTDGEFTVTPAE